MNPEFITLSQIDAPSVRSDPQFALVFSLPRFAIFRRKITHIPSVGQA